MELNNSITKVDFNQYKDAYDKDVIQAWKGREVELDVETLRALMYGFTFTQDYADGNLEESLFMDFWRDNSSDLDLELDSENGFDDPIDEAMNNMMDDDYMVDTPEERLLMKTIDSTGDGKSPETAFCVIDVHQEHEYIERKFPFCCLRMTRQSVCNGIDCLNFDENPFGIDCIYFDIKRRFEVGYPGCQGMEFENDDFMDVELNLLEEDSGHRLHEMARMDSPEDNLGDGIEIWVCNESADNDGIIEPHFHVCKDKKGDGHHYAVDIEVKIRNIEKMTIWRSKTGHLTWDDLSNMYNTVLEWLNKKAFDADITNKEAIRQEWNRCNTPSRVKREEL